MEQDAIKVMRKRLGLTQRQLADKLDVDQGTVSRWERGLEVPRPARLGALRSLLMRDDDRRALLRSIAFVEHDVLPSTLLDARLRLVRMSVSARRHFRERGYEPDALIDMQLERYVHRDGIPDFEAFLHQSGLLSGEALLFRFARSYEGRGHATVYQPIFEAGTLVGVLAYATRYFRFSDNAARALELVETYRLDDPATAHLLYRGNLADEAIAALRPQPQP